LHLPELADHLTVKSVYELSIEPTSRQLLEAEIQICCLEIGSRKAEPLHLEASLVKRRITEEGYKRLSGVSQETWLETTFESPRKVLFSQH
jgi:hypothetical protein